MTEPLLDHIKKYTSLDHTAAEDLATLFETLGVSKKKLIVSEGELCPYIYFVAKGCLRMFYFDDKGVEQTIQFALENWWMTDIDAFNRNGRSSFFIQAVENTV